MAKSIKTLISFNKYTIPVKIYKEWRSSVRYSLGRKSAIIRLPVLYPRKMLQSEIDRLEQWLITQINKDERVGSRFIVKQYKTGDELNIRGQRFILSIKRENRKTNTAKISDDLVQFKISDTLNTLEESEVIRKLLSRTFSKYFLAIITDLVLNINKQHFKKDILSVKLKDNQSNWGSCSSKRNINLSSRLLLAPQDVLEYVIVHELAHLIEMNHSNAFWTVVKNVMPDYKSKELWLNKNGHSLKF